MRFPTPLTPIIISKLIGSGGGGGDVTAAEVKTALLNCLMHVLWKDNEGLMCMEQLEDALYPNAVLISISANFDQGQAIIYDTDSLDDLRRYLTVTGTYDDGSTRTAITYTLSGKLTPGTSTITVSYKNAETTFNVEVTRSAALLNAWDLKKSLTDDIGGVLANTTATQNDSGVTFDTGSKYIDFGEVYAYNRTYQIDVESMSLDLGTGKNYGRLWMIDSDSNTASGGSGFIIATIQKGGDLFYIDGAWESNLILSASDDNKGAYFSGKTVAFYVDGSGLVSVYVDGTLIGKSTHNMPIANGQHVYIGSSGSASTDIMYNSVITGFRVFAGKAAS